MYVSPYHRGRPGWHIECSAMATDLLGTQFDIHTGGEDLKFPHHDNELAQSEAFSNGNQWVNYFLHAGHLSIAGLKMSKSLKNFVTIRQCLEHNTARQIRLLFLLQSWDGTMAYSDDSLKEAVTKETSLKSFFHTVDTRIKEQPVISAVNQLFNQQDKELNEAFMEAQERVHSSLLNNLDYPAAMSEIMGIIKAVNNYFIAIGQNAPKSLLLTRISAYVDKMLRVFGVIPEGHASFLTEYAAAAAQSGAGTEFASKVIDAFASYRDKIRDAVKTGGVSVMGESQGNEETKGGSLPTLKSAIMKLSDEVRDDILPPLGIRLDDRVVPNPSGAGAMASSIWKLDDPKAMAKEKEEKLRAEKEKVLNKLVVKVKTVQKTLTTVEEGVLPVDGMFKTDQYTQWDEKGLPTHDKDGQPLTKGALKQVAKLKDVREKARDALEKLRVTQGTETGQAALDKLKAEIVSLNEEVAKIQASISN